MKLWVFLGKHISRLLNIFNSFSSIDIDDFSGREIRRRVEESLPRDTLKTRYLSIAWLPNQIWYLNPIICHGQFSTFAEFELMIDNRTVLLRPPLWIASLKTYKRLSLSHLILASLSI